MTDTKYAKPALKFDDVPKWFKDMRNSSDFMPTKFDLKPMSYNYMALVEQPNRSQAYSPASAQSRVDIGTQYHRPTDNVAKAIKSNQTVWQDIKNLGGEVKEHGGNLLGRVIDVLSRPGYAIRNMYLENAKRNYTTANSAGGTKMTGGEHLMAVLDMTPFGSLRNIARGQYDDDLKAGWAGLSGKAKTNTADVLKQVTPGWWAKNQNTKLGLAASITGDILIDPTTWLTMGLNPGSVTRAGVGVGKLLTFDKAGAAAMFKDTIFTPTGMKQTFKTMKSDQLMADYNKLSAQARKFERRGNKTAAKVAKGKATKKTEQYYTLKATEYAKRAEGVLAEDLKGIDLAARMIKRNLNPLNALQTASRFTTGAKAGSDILRGQSTIAAAADVFYEAAAKDMAKGSTTLPDGTTLSTGDLWNKMYAAGSKRDFTYEHNGRQYTVKLSQAKNYHEWLKMIAQESAPVASYAEYSSRSARSRAGRIAATEARGREFQNAWIQHTFSTLRDSIDPNSWGAVRQGLINRWEMGNRVTRKAPVDKVIKNNPALALVDEEEFLKGGLSLEDLHTQARSKWVEYEQSKVGKPRQFSENNAHVIMVDKAGEAHVVGIEALRKWHVRQAESVATPVARASAAAARTPQQTAVDNITGVSDSIAGRREKLLQDHAAALAERDAMAARVAQMTPEEAQQFTVMQRIEQRFQDALSDSEMGQVREMLSDQSIPWETRLATLLKDEMFDTAEVVKVAEDIFGVEVVDGIIKATRANVTPDVAIPQIVQAVLRDRLGARVSDDMLKNAGYAVTSEGDVKLTRIDDADYRSHTADVNGEIGLALLDSWSAGLRYAADMQMLNDPKNFDLVMDHLTQQSMEFINMASADTKMQVMMLLRNTFGMAFPESFVPNAARVTATFGDINTSAFKFENATGVAPNQSIPWRNLAKEIRLWSRSALPWVDSIENIPTALSKVDADVNAVRKAMPMEFYEDADEVILALEARARVLLDKVSPKDYNATGVPEVANYSMLDYLMHTKDILNAQKTKFIHKGSSKARRVQGEMERGNFINRLNIGRLSALDSFGYIDEETRNALEALAQLKDWSNRNVDTLRSGEAVKQTRSRQVLAGLFTEHGGFEHLARVNDISRTDFTGDFNTLGAHVRLKQGIVNDRLNGGFGPKYAADLMEHMWQVPTINHEWQKALQHRILAGVIIDGRKPTQVAEDIAKNVDEFFKNHEGIKTQLYPVFTSASKVDQGFSSRTILNRGDKLQENWGTPNQVEVAQNAPAVVVPIGKRQVYLESGKTQFTPEELRPVTIKADNTQLFNWFSAKTKDAIALDALISGQATATKFGDMSLPRFYDPKTKKMLISNEIIPVGGAKSGNGYIVRHLGDASSAVEKKPALYYISPDTSQVFRIAYTDDINNVEQINRSLDEILSPTPTRTARHDPRLDALDYRPGAHVLSKDIEYTKAPTKKTESTQVVPKPATPEQIQATSGIAEARWNELNAQLKADELQGQIDALPVEQTPTAAPEAAPEPTPTAAPESNVPEEGIPTGAVEPDDVINPGPNSYSPEEVQVIREWIEESYSSFTPDEVSKALYGHVMAMSWDLAITQARLTSGLADMNIAQKASVRFMGMPFMPAVSPMNATHANAGVTAMAQYRSGAHKFFADLMDPTTNPTSWGSRTRLKMTKESQILEGTLMNIRRKAVNAAAMSRKIIIDDLNMNYSQVTKGDYVAGSMAGLSKKEKFRMASEALFDPAKVAQKNSLDTFELTDGSNPLKTIEAKFEANSRVAFGDEADKLSESDFKEKFRVFNSYMPKKFRLAEHEMEAIHVAGLTELPYSRQWLSAVGSMLPPDSALNISKLKEANLAELHYAMTDAALKIEEGRALYKAVWGEFSFAMEPSVAKYINDSVQPTTTGPNGAPMRGKLVNIGQELRAGNSWGISPEKIPEEFKGIMGTRYVDSTFLPQIATLFRFMEGSDKLNDVLDAGFIDKILQYFKASVTIYKVPTYPVRNMMADAFLSAMDGLTQPKYYKWAAGVMQNASRLSREIDENGTVFAQILDKNFMGEEMARAAHDPLSVADPMTGPGITKLLLRTADGTAIRLDDTQLVSLFDELGLGQNQIVGEIKEKLAASRMTGTMTAAGKLHDSLRTLNDWRESWARMAHFLYALEKEAPMGGNLQDIAQRAAERVIKHHFDYNDVSIWERNVLAPIIPFYKWVRNIIPYTVTSVITKPYMLKTEQAIQQGLQGLDDNSNDPRTDFVVPEYIRREQAVDVGWYSDPNGNKFMQWATINLPLSETLAGTFAPTLEPVLDPSGGGADQRFLAAGAGAIRTGVAMTNPLVKGIIQGATGKTVWPHGASDERAGESWFKTMATTVPGVPLWDSMQKSVKDMTAPGMTDKNTTAQLLKELGVIGLTNNSEKAQIGEVKRIQDLNEGYRNRLKAELMNKLEKKYPQTTPDQRRMIVDEYVKSMRSSNG